MSEKKHLKRSKNVGQTKKNVNKPDRTTTGCCTVFSKMSLLTSICSEFDCIRLPRILDMYENKKKLLYIVPLV